MIASAGVHPAGIALVLMTPRTPENQIVADTAQEVLALIDPNTAAAIDRNFVVVVRVAVGGAAHGSCSDADWDYPEERGVIREYLSEPPAIRLSERRTAGQVFEPLNCRR